MTKPGLVSVLIFAALAVQPGGADDNSVIHFKGKANWSLATRASTTNADINPKPAGLAVIFSNLGDKNHLYENNVAWDVTGSDAPVQQQSVAMPFTPAFDAEVTEIAIAVGHQSGSPNSFVLSLNADSGGPGPGAPLHIWIVNQSPKFGTCCEIDTAKDVTGVKVRKGTQYWVVAQPIDPDAQTVMEWNLSTVFTEANFAFNNGQGWFEFTAFRSAFAVYGRAGRRTLTRLT